MTKSDRLVIVAMFIMLFIVMVLQAGIYWDTKPQEEYEIVVVEGTVNVTALERGGYYTIEESGYIQYEEEGWFHREGKCEICEAIQSGNITLISWDEASPSSNFTVIMKDSLAVRGKEE